MNEKHYVILNWNARGLRECRATIVSLQETKLEVIDKRLVCEILGNSFVDNFVCLPSVGASGGVLLVVSTDHYSIPSSEVGVHTVTTTVTTYFDTVSWSIITVYGPQGDAENYSFWENSGG